MATAAVTQVTAVGDAQIVAANAAAQIQSQFTVTKTGIDRDRAIAGAQFDIDATQAADAKDFSGIEPTEPRSGWDKFWNGVGLVFTAIVSFVENFAVAFAIGALLVGTLVLLEATTPFIVGFSLDRKEESLGASTNDPLLHIRKCGELGIQCKQVAHG